MRVNHTRRQGKQCDFSGLSHWLTKRQTSPYPARVAQYTPLASPGRLGFLHFFSAVALWRHRHISRQKRPETNSCYSTDPSNTLAVGPPNGGSIMNRIALTV